MASGSAVISEACGRVFMGGGPGVKKGRLAYLPYLPTHIHSQTQHSGASYKARLGKCNIVLSYARDMELYLGKRHRYQFCAQGEYIITLVRSFLILTFPSFLHSHSSYSCSPTLAKTHVPKVHLYCSAVQPQSYTLLGIRLLCLQDGYPICRRLLALRRDSVAGASCPTKTSTRFSSRYSGISRKHGG